MFHINYSKSPHLLCLLTLLLLLSNDVLLAQKAAVNKYNITWKDEMSSKIYDNETVSLLSFEGAQYDGSLHSFPYFSLRELSRFPGMEVSVSIKNAVYEPLATKNTYDFSSLPSEPQVFVTTGTERKAEFTGISFIPLRKNPSTNSVEKLISFDLEILPGAVKRTTQKTSSRVFAPSSVLASGNWYKLAVNKTGIHIINSEVLQQMGLSPASVNPAKVRLFGNGGGMLPHINSEFRHDDLAENAIFVSDGGVQGIFDGDDYVLFYGQAPTSWKYDPTSGTYSHQLHLFSDFTYYFFTPDLNLGSGPKRIQSQPSNASTPNYVSNSFDEYQFHEIDALNFIKSGRQWYGEQFDVNLTQNFTFNVPGINLSEQVYVKSNVIAHSFSPSYFRLNYGSQLLFPQNIPAVGASYTSDYAAENSSSTLFNAVGSTLTFSLTYYPSTSTSVGYLNYLEINARRNLSMVGNQMAFRDKNTIGPGNITQFNFTASPTVRVWDVTDPVNVRQQAYSTGTKFNRATDSLLQFVAFDGTSFFPPLFAGVVPNQNLHGLDETDMVILTHPNFISEAIRLAQFHKSNNNLDVVVVTPQQVYNEFSSGATDLIGIRDFLKMFYDRASNPADAPKYFLAFGDGSYDNKGTQASNTNFIPTYQSLNSISLINSYVSDDFYGFLDDDEGDWEDNTVIDLLDIGIGRFPVKTMEEAITVVNKTIDYATPGTFSNSNLCSDGNTSSLGDWRNILCFIADDEDTGLHLNQSNSLANFIDNNHPEYNVDKIFIDSYSQVSTPGGQRYPSVNDAINRRVDKGALIINYTGHGGETGWAGERILDNSMIQSWSNKRKLPLFITATCEFSRYDDPGRTSAGELVLINSEAGGVALMTTTRLVYAAQNGVLNTAMINTLFEPVNGQMPRLGDVYMSVKNNNSVLQGGINPRNFSLLGDPALMLAYPKYDVVTKSINGVPIVPGADTVGALSKVTIAGEVQNNGQKLTGFNGIIYPTVYDKSVSLTTLGNDPSSPKISFTLRNNVLYKGKASVTNGEFTFTFIVPKDIAYTIGNGRLSYYAHNGVDDASGTYDSLLIGGSSNNLTADEVGPDIKLYLNDEKFVFGGTTDENPKILALVTDTNGINTVGNGVGHDITGTVDNDPNQIYVLNDYYESDLDSYQSGRVLYPLSKLASGHHTLKFKVWDIYNNSSESYTEFVVAESAELALNHVLNYPNPFTTKTSFFFEHNRPCSSLDVQVQVYTVSGKLIKTINRSVACEGYRVDDISWDGRDDYGDRIGRGVYVYRLKIRDTDGATAEKYEKLVVLK